MNEQDFEVVIIGGGAAGLSAALVLGRARRRVAVTDAGQPRNAPAAHMQGFLSRDGMPPSELLAAGRAEVSGCGVELVNDRVVDNRGQRHNQSGKDHRVEGHTVQVEHDDGGRDARDRTPSQPH